MLLYLTGAAVCFVAAVACITEAIHSFHTHPIIASILLAVWFVLALLSGILLAEGNSR